MLEERLLTWKFNRGNRDVLCRVYQKYKDDLMTLAAALLYDRSSAEDVVHDVFVNFIRSCGGLRVRQSLKGYLTTAVANSARNRNKSRQRHQSTGLDQVAPIASHLNRPDFWAIFGEQSQRLAWALSQLPYEQREVVLLHLHSGLKFKTIAKAQGESINTVQGRYRYGLEKLQSLVNSKVKNETFR
jgi:RNA polymerase sigma-70 factor (ECF subfamily)